MVEAFFFALFHLSRKYGRDYPQRGVDVYVIRIVFVMFNGQLFPIQICAIRPRTAHSVVGDGD